MHVCFVFRCAAIFGRTKLQQARLEPPTSAVLVPGHVSNRHAGTYGPLMPAEASTGWGHRVGGSISSSVEQVKSQELVYQA